MLINIIGKYKEYDYIMLDINNNHHSEILKMVMDTKDNKPSVGFL
jgi:hypothetical protein